jgi:hypothetical protein
METVSPRRAILPIGRVQKEVGEWSIANFGDQTSKFDGTTMGPRNPLLGMIEEIGEACESTTADEFKDAIGDVGIYLCDYASREGIVLAALIPMPELIREYEVSDTYKKLYAAAGRLCRCTLKRDQGIRDFMDQDHYAKYRDEAITCLIAALAAISRLNGFDFLHIVGETWVKIVSKRDWKTDPSKGGEGCTNGCPACDDATANDAEASKIEEGQGLLS